MTSTDTELRSLSLWWSTLPEDLAGPRRAPLPGSAEADVVIVGAGYTGLWTAYYLAKADPSLRIVVLEREVAGFGASGRNGGWCSALFPASWNKIAKGAGREAAIALQRAMFATVDEVGSVIEAEGLDVHWAKGGTTTLARTSVQFERARAEIEEARSWGFREEDYRWLSAEEARASVGATHVRGGTFTPHTAALNPARLVRGLAQVVERLGVTIHEGTEVTAIEPGIVRTKHGRVRAPYCLRATEGYTARLDGHRRDIVPVYSLMVATDRLPQAFWDEVGLAQRPTFADHRHLIIYGQRTADDRLAFGGRGAPYHFGSAVEAGFDREPEVFAGLKRVLVDLFPALGDVTLSHTWGGPLGLTRDWYASCTLDRSTGMGWAGGYVGDGVGTSNLAGRTLADLVLERETDLVRLPWVNHRSRRWEPEPFRFLGVNSGLQMMSSADRAEQRSGRPARRAVLINRLLGH